MYLTFVRLRLTMRNCGANMCISIGRSIKCFYSNKRCLKYLKMFAFAIACADSRGISSKS